MTEFNKIKVKLHLTIGFVIGNQEEDVLLCDYGSEAEWNKLNLFEKDDFVQEEILKEWANNYIEMYAEVQNGLD